MSNLHVLIMAGGSGTRFWPRSRKDRPKQFLAIAGETSLLRATVDRARDLCPPERIHILTRADLIPQVRACCPELGADQVVAEPEARDTAPALVLAAARVAARDPDATLLILPADHVIRDVDAFTDSIRGACASLEHHDGLITFGVRPSYPATGFGYIRRASGDGDGPEGARTWPVDSFAEKPAREVAIRYFESGDYLWNAGIFLWRGATFRAALERWAPDLASGWDRLTARFETAGLDASFDEEFRTLPRISIDYALLEKADNVRVATATFPWDDVGSWRAVERYRDADAAGNVTEGRVVLLDSRDSTVLASGQRVVAGYGLDGLAIIDTEDALLVCPRDRVEDLKPLIRAIEQSGAEDVL